MKIYGQDIDKLSTEELEHRRSYLKRNQSLYEQTGIKSLIEKRIQELDEIETELFARGVGA